ncbi:MAG: Ku protein [Burkholderiaceae bacterium]
MAARSLASLSLSFGLVSIPVKLYSATESSATVRFNMLAPDGARVKQQYVSEKTGKVVERSEMLKGYEFEKDRFVMFQPDELKALDEAASHVIDIVSFVPEKSVDPIYYDRAYFLAPDKRGGKPYELLLEAMRESGRCALARWTNHGKQYVVQVRAGEDGLVLQQLLYAAEVRSQKDLDIEKVPVAKGELQLALQLIEQIAQDAYDPTQFEDEEKKRILEAIDRKIAGKQVVESARAEEAGTGAGQVIDLAEALKASLSRRPAAKAAPAASPARSAEVVSVAAPKDRKPARRATPAAEPAPARARARK